MTGRGQDAAGFTALSRSVGVPGDEVAISGERFGVDGTPGQAVTLAGNGVQVVSWTPGEVRIRLPRTADAGGPGEKALVVRPLRLPGTTGSILMNTAVRRQENQGETQARGVSGLSYRLMTGVPEFWIPLVPRELQGSPRLARVAMRRMAPDGQPEEIPPRGRILGGNELLIHDEEVPRDGANVTRAWQLARDPSGQTHLWTGRSKGPGRGEGSSGLAFDVLEEG